MWVHKLCGYKLYLQTLNAALASCIKRSINKYLVVLSMAMMHVCISPESIPGSKHVYWYTWLSYQKPCLTLVYYSASMPC